MTEKIKNIEAEQLYQQDMNEKYFALNKFEISLSVYDNTIIDEVQNMISETGSFHRNLKKLIDNSDDKTRVILLSATPMFDKPVEVAMTLNLLKPDKELVTGTAFNQKYLSIKRRF